MARHDAAASLSTVTMRPVWPHRLEKAIKSSTQGGTSTPRRRVLRRSFNSARSSAIGTGSSNPRRLVDELVLRHHEMVLLMMRSLHHDSHEAECPEFCHLLGVGAGDGELDAIRQVFRFGVPAELAKLVHVRGDHALDGIKRTALAGYCDLNTVVEGALSWRGAHGHLIHVDQVFT